MRKKIKLLSIILTLFFSINIWNHKVYLYEQIQFMFIHKNFSTNIKNINLLAPVNTDNANDSTVTDNGNTSSNNSQGATSDNNMNSNEQQNSSNVNGGSNSSTIEPISPVEPVEPTEPSVPSNPSSGAEASAEGSSQHSTSTVTNSGSTSTNNNSSIKSSGSSSTGSYSTKKTTNSVSSKSSGTSSKSSTATSKKSSDSEEIENTAATSTNENSAVPVNNNVNNQVQTSTSENLLLIKASLSKGDVIIDDKSNEIKLSCDSADLKEIYYVFSKNKDVDHNEKWIKYSSSLKFHKDGTWYIHYKAIDKNGKESYGVFGPYNVSYKYKSLEGAPADNTFKKKIIGCSMIAVIVIFALVYIIKTNKSPYSKLKNEDN